MASRDKELLEMIREALGKKNRVYIYNHKKKDGSKRLPQAMLIIREMGSLKNVIVPLFYKKLKGDKSRQFEEWISKIESDTFVPKLYKLIPILYRSGFYEKINKFD